MNRGGSAHAIAAGLKPIVADPRWRGSPLNTAQHFGLEPPSSAPIRRPGPPAPTVVISSALVALADRSRDRTPAAWLARETASSSKDIAPHP